MTTCICNYDRSTYNMPTNKLINEAQKMLEVRRGDLVRVDLDQLIKYNKNHCVQAKSRPCLVLQNNVGNKYSPTILVATLTSNLNKTKLPTHVKVSRNEGLISDSLVLIEQQFTVDKSMVIEKVGRCPDYIMEQIDMALKIQAELISQDYIKDTVNWINKVEAEAYERGFDPEDAKLHIRLVKELQSYCNQYGYDYMKLLKEKTFVRVSSKNKQQNVI